ncbi:uncharacterized protein EV420DRAFT_1585001 [Desarmillaria tabescens]|uniref:Mid2 domain-containing protein n=1 Tax=Armillaria tabescens TaxID=1929756 RepID=A0AA39JA53_ARMTA|nr:uncharacterized protein EV420DRAFT_1585001 [Desarmillaria tabescens]KAK0438863.1 hypothetical protein EV420DRAFT_1585001 [Desarmillaria tabescens]
MVGYSNYTCDDRLDVFKYTGSWNYDDYNASSVNQIGTLTWTDDLTANVTFTFPVKANAFYYYSIPRCCGGLYAICIDCDLGNPKFEIIDAVRAGADSESPPDILYTKSFDQLGIHEIILKNQYDSRGPSQLTVDKFVFQIEDNSVTSATESLTGTSGASSSSIFVSSSTAPAVSQSTRASPSASQTPIGAIVGGVVGGIAVISLCLIIWFFKQRRQRTQPEHNDVNTSSYISPHQQSPFIISHPNTPIPTPYTVMETTSQHMPKGARRASVAAGPSIPNAPLGHAHLSSSRMASDERWPQRENDAGRIDADDGGNNIVTFPPGYEDIVSGGHLDGEQLTTRGPTL